MNLLFRVLDAAHCRSTHHKLAMDALRLLKRDDAGAWVNVFLKHHQPYLQGAKEPDVKFRDFRNHVLHVSDDYWGGAREAARLWYGRSLQALRQRDWVNGIYAAGILSHYYTDPIQPFHTGQSEEENNIHRACEWSITKSYDDLRAMNDRLGAWPVVEMPDGDEWLERMVEAGAEKSHASYQPLIDHYNFDAGRKKPQAGLDDQCRTMLAELTAYAAAGFARILDRLLDEAQVPPPKVSLTIETVLSSLEMPLSWVTRKLENSRERKLVAAMYAELQSTGRVERTLPDDDREVRNLHCVEVLGEDPAVLYAITEPATAAPPDDASSGSGSAENSAADSKDTGEDEAAGDNDVRSSADTDEADDDSDTLQFRLELDMPVEAAPSIGAKTANRLATIGISTVRDFLDADATAMAAMLNVKHITVEDLEDWQAQALLACEMPGIHGHDAQILVACGYDDPVAIIDADPKELLAAALKFVATPDGQRALRSSRAPDAAEVDRWIEWAGHARDLRAA